MLYMFFRVSKGILVCVNPAIHNPYNITINNVRADTHLQMIVHVSWISFKFYAKTVQKCIVDIYFIVGFWFEKQILISQQVKF